MGFEDLYDLAPHGYVDLAMGHAAGITPERLNRRAASDGWDPQPGGGWRLPSHPDTPQLRLVAAVRQTSPDAVADRHSAMALHGVVSSFPTRPQLLLPHECRSRNDALADVRRSRRLLACHVEEVDRIPCVRPARAIADLAADLDTPALRSLALACQRDRLLTVDELAEVLDTLPKNAKGRRRLRQVVRDLAADGSESGFEFTTRTRMRHAGLRPDDDQPTVSVAGRRRRIDIAWLVLRVGVECQGYLAHVGARALDRDAGRLNALIARDDWLILQLTPYILHEGWDAFLTDLRSCLARRARAAGLPMPAGVAV